MKLIRSAAVVALSLAIASCASLNEGLKNVNEGLGKMTGTQEPTAESGQTASGEVATHESQLAYKSSGTRTVKFTVPARLCAPDEWINSFEINYSNVWNDRVRGKQNKFLPTNTAEKKAKYAELDGRMLVPPKPLPLASAEETKRRDRLASECTNDRNAYGPAATAAQNDALAELPD